MRGRKPKHGPWESDGATTVPIPSWMKEEKKAAVKARKRGIKHPFDSVNEALNFGTNELRKQLGIGSKTIKYDKALEFLTLLCTPQSLTPSERERIQENLKTTSAKVQERTRNAGKRKPIISRQSVIEKEAPEVMARLMEGRISPQVAHNKLASLLGLDNTPSATTLRLWKRSRQLARS